LKRWLVKAGEVEEIVEHPLLDLFNNVNAFANEFDLLELMFLYLDLTGNCYWLLDRNMFGLPGQIWILQPQRIKIVPSRENFIEGFEYKVSAAEKVVYNPDEVIHFKYPHPDNLFYGLGPLEAAAVAADLSFGMNTYETSLMNNRAQPDMALVLPEDSGEPSEDEIKRTYRRWRQRFGGAKRAGKMVVLTGGAKLEQLSLSPKEMNFLHGRKASVNEIAAIFGVPLSKLRTEDVNKANAEVGETQYARDTIKPKLIKVEQKLNERLAPIYDENIFVAFDNPVPDDKKFELKRLETNLKTGLTTINEEREVEGRESVSWGEVPLLPATLVPVGGGVEGPPAKAKNVKAVKRSLPPLNHPTNFVNEPLVQVLERFFVEQRDEILAAFDNDIGKSVVLSARYSTKQNVDDFLAGWFDLSKWDGELIKRMEPFIRYTMFAGGERAIRSLVSDRPFDSISPRVMVALEKHRHGAIEYINGNKLKKLRKTISDGMAVGESPRELRNRIIEAYGLARYDAERIARTETIWAWNEGAVQGYIQSGIVKKKEWLSSADDRTCDWCPLMDGKVVDVEANFFSMGDNFNVDGSVLNFEYEDVGHPPLHPQCRCTIVPVIEEF
jgi:HK97 family phage portal protein